MKRHVLPVLLALPLLAAASRELDAQEQVFFRVQEMRECGRLGVAFGPGEEPWDPALVVEELLPGAPAERAGLRPGDVVVRIDGRQARPESLPVLAGDLRPGQAVQLRVRRDGRERDLQIVAARDLCPRRVVVGLGPEEARRALAQFRAADGVVIRLDTVRVNLDTLLRRVRVEERMLLDSLRRSIVALERTALDSLQRQLEFELPRRLQALRVPDVVFFSEALPGAFVQGIEIGQRAVAGAEFSELNRDLAQYFHGASEGLLVLRVAPETPSARAGLQPGDVVVRAGDRPVRTVGDLRGTIAGSGGGSVPMDVIRKGKRLELRLATGR